MMKIQYAENPMLNIYNKLYPMIMQSGPEKDRLGE